MDGILDLFYICINVDSGRCCSLLYSLDMKNGCYYI